MKRRPAARRKPEPPRRARIELRGTPRGPRRPIRVPVRFVSVFVGLFLLVPGALLTQTFFTCLSRETVHAGFWASEAFWFFALGALLWTIAFVGLPRPVVLYVFGHELTHALAVWMTGGRVSAFRVGADGGHIVADRRGPFIALAPYFVPLYSVMVICLFGLAGCFWDVAPYRRHLFAAIGITWAFHATFTLWMIPKGQSDLALYGTFFSLAAIYVANLAVLSLFLVAASPGLTWAAFGAELFENSALFSRWAWSQIERARAAWSGG